MSLPRFAVAFSLLIVAFSLLAVACRPAPPAPIAAPTCAASPEGGVIAAEFAAVAVPQFTGQADAIAYNESRCQAGEVNRSGASGLFQFIIPLHQDLMNACPFLWHSALDDWCNAWAAAVTFEQQGGCHPAWNGDGAC